SPVVANGGNRRQIEESRKPQKQAKTVAVGCDPLPETFHGKDCHEEGPPPVTGSGLSTGAIERRPEFDVVRRFGSQPQASRLPSARRRGCDGRGRCGATGC